MKGNIVDIKKNIEAAIRWLKRGSESLDKGETESTLMYLTIGSAESKRAREKLLEELRVDEAPAEDNVVRAPRGIFQGRFAAAGRMVAVAGFLLVGFTISHFADQAKIARLEEEVLAKVRELDQGAPSISDPEVVPPGERIRIGDGRAPDDGSGGILDNTNRLIREWSMLAASLREQQSTGGDSGWDDNGYEGGSPSVVSFDRVRGGDRFESPFPIVEVEPVSFPLHTSDDAATPVGSRMPPPEMREFIFGG